MPSCALPGSWSPLAQAAQSPVRLVIWQVGELERILSFNLLAIRPVSSRAGCPLTQPKSPMKSPKNIMTLERCSVNFSKSVPCLPIAPMTAPLSSFPVPLCPAVVCNLSRPEREAMEEYIQDSLSAGSFNQPLVPLVLASFLWPRKICLFTPVLTPVVSITV